MVAKNVTTADQGEDRIVILATQCILEAASQGVVVAHVEEDGASVESVIKDAMAHLAAPGTPGD